MQFVFYLLVAVGFLEGLDAAPPSSPKPSNNRTSTHGTSGINEEQENEKWISGLGNLGLAIYDSERSRQAGHCVKNYTGACFPYPEFAACLQPPNVTKDDVLQLHNKIYRDLKADCPTRSNDRQTSDNKAAEIPDKTILDKIIDEREGVLDMHENSFKQKGDNGH